MNSLLCYEFVKKTPKTKQFFLIRFVGNEPDYPQLSISGEQLGTDTLTLRNILDNLKGFEKSKVVGPDIGISTGYV